MAGLSMSLDLAGFLSEELSSVPEGKISLAHIAARRTSVSWVEALACIQQICDAIARSGQGPLTESVVFLHPAGTASIEAPGQTTPEESVRFAGELLSAWLEGTPHPMALNTIILSATDSPPSYASIAELSAALKPYERPERAQLVRTVYQRAGGSRSRERTERPAAADAPAAVPAVTPPSSPAETEFGPGFEGRDRASRRIRQRVEMLDIAEASSASTLFSRETPIEVEKPPVPAPDQNPAQHVRADIGGRMEALRDGAIAMRRRVVVALQQLLERAGSLIQRSGPLVQELRPFAKPLAVLLLVGFALVVMAMSGWLLFKTLATSPGTSAASAPPAAAAPPVAVTADAAPVAPQVQVDATVTRAPAPPPPAPLAVTAMSAGQRPMRTSSIVLAPARPGRTPPPPAARRSERAPAVRLSAALPPSSAPAVIGNPSTAPSTTPAVDVPLNAAGAPATSVARPPAARVAPETIFSAADADVTPPVQIYPQYIEGNDRERPNASPFQLVIDERGHVESAVLARRPADMGETVSGTLMLAAAKSWRFRPASKDGQPVKYRRIIWFSNP